MVAETLNIDGREYVLTLDDEFNEDYVRFWQGYGSGGVWATSFSPHLDDTRYLAANNELQYYVDPDMDAFTNPFTVGDGAVTIHASKLTEAQQSLADGQQYSSGLMNSEMTFAAKSGYIEMRADLPSQQGFWSSLWLLPADGDWSTEVDIFEVLGGNADTVHTDVWVDGVNDHLAIYDTGAGEGFHTYGLHWSEDGLTWFLNGDVVRETAVTIPEEMYISISLAIGGWAGTPDETTDLSDGMSIDYVRVYELESDANRNQAIKAGDFAPMEREGGSRADDIINGSRWDDTINAGFGWDIVYGDEGNDRIRGGAGRDELFGHADNDRLFGSFGLDRLVGGTGRDWLRGGEGKDYLWGGTLAGGDGEQDTFAFVAGGGRDFAFDFEVGIDLIDIRSLDTSWEEVSNAMTDEGWMTKINLWKVGNGETGDVMHLVDVSVAELTADDFMF